MDAGLRAIKDEMVRRIVLYLTRSDGAIATPGDELARLRREILRGLRS